MKTATENERESKYFLEPGIKPIQTKARIISASDDRCPAIFVCDRDAQDVLKACNSHASLLAQRDALLAALYECLAVIEALDSCECEPSETTCDNCAAMDSARRAIKLAAGGE